MLTRYGDEATAESAKRAEALEADGALAGVAVWLFVRDPAEDRREANVFGIRVAMVLQRALVAVKPPRSLWSFTDRQVPSKQNLSPSQL